MNRVTFMATLLMVCALTVSFSQERKRRLTSIGFIYSPNYSYRKLNYASSAKWIEDYRNQHEVAKLGFTTGINLRFRWNNNIKLETGLLYSNKGMKTKTERLNWSSGDPSLPVKSRTVFHYQFIELPARVNYAFISTKKLNAFGSIGVNLNLFLARKTEVVLEYENKSTDAHATRKNFGNIKFNPALTMSAGLDYLTSKRVMLRLEPVYQRFLNSIVADNSAKEYLFSYGINVGLFYLLSDKKKSLESIE